MRKQFVTIAKERELRKNTLIKRAGFWFKNKKYLSQGFAQKVKKARTLATAVLIVSFIAQIGIGILGIKAVSTQGPNDPELHGSLAVANVNTGTNYHEDFVDALSGQVVKFELAYHNNRPPDSGIIAHNVVLRVALPSGMGTNLVATGFVTSSNANSFSDPAAVHTQVPAYLEYMPGSAQWRHNIGTNEAPNIVTEAAPDSVVTTGFNVGDVLPCGNFQGAVAVLARVKAPSLRVEKKVGIPGTPWVKENTVNPGDTMSYLITFENMGNTQLTNMAVRDSLPPYMTYVPGSTILYNTNHPNGVTLTDDVIGGGVIVGNYNSGSNGHIRFRVTINTTGIPVGCHALRNVGIVRADQFPDVWDTTITNVCIVGPQEPEFTISKSVFNETQNVDATTTLAHAGDIVRYNLITQNTGDGAGQYTIQDDIGVILQYADITNNGGGTVASNNISYGTVNINPGEIVERNFWVQVKPFASWPNGCTGDPQMVNVYGNEIRVRLGCYNILQKKSAFNNTRSVDATSTFAHAGDTITYTLTATNTGIETFPNYVISDDISDILEFADVTDTGGGTVVGSSISWPAVDIPAGGSVSKTFVIKIKDLVSMACGFQDLTNTYGNTVKVFIEKPCPTPSILGAAVGPLAAAGGGNLLLMIGSMLFMLASSAYLYFREKVLLLNTLRNI